MKYHQTITMHLYALKYADILSDLQLPVIFQDEALLEL